MSKNYFLELIKDETRIIDYQRGDVIIHEGTELSDLFIMIEGKAKVVQNYENGKHLLVQFLRPINLLGDIEYICEHQEATCTVIATTACKFALISFGELDQKYKNDLRFNQNLLKYTSGKLLVSSSKNALNVIYDVKTKLASYLLAVENNGVVQLYSQDELSSYLGSSYRHLSRCIKELIKDEVIIKNGRHLTIINQNRLIELSRGNIYEI